MSAFWSGEKGTYCSFRCNAAGNYRRSLPLLFLVLGMTGVAAVMVFTMVAKSPPVTQIHPFIILLLIILTIPSLSCVYIAYVGRSMNRARQMNDT